jgi:predicted nucleic acid-binding protein
VILLDTNVVSEAIKPEPHGSVRTWLDAQAAETLFVSSVTVAELLFGIGVLPRGKRRERLRAAVDGLLDLFDGRILPFDTLAAKCYADLAVRARAAGKGFPTPDGYIAAIAAAHELVVASRDLGAFAAAGVRVIDPWRESA